MQVGSNNQMWNFFSTLHLPPVLRRGLVVLLALVLLVGGGWVVHTWVLPWLAPTYRTQFLVDATGEDAEGIARSLRQALNNSGDEDSLGLRGFGGECGAADNTEQLVDFGTGNQAEIGQAAGHRRGGRATLLRGIIEATADFDGLFTLRARQVNRIILITRHGGDACDEDAEFVGREIRSRLAAAGLSIELRLVGYQVPDPQREKLKRIAGGAGAPEPLFATDQAGLDAALEFFTNTEPVLRNAREIVDALNPAVDKLNQAVTAITDGRLDTAETQLAEAKSAAGQTGTRFTDLGGRAKTPAVQEIHRQAQALARLQERLLEAATDMLSAARAARPLGVTGDDFRRLAADYNGTVDRVNKAVAALRASAPAGAR